MAMEDGTRLNGFIVSWGGGVSRPSSCSHVRRCTMPENRKAVRYDIHVPVQICASQHSPAEFHAAQLRDISRTGIFFHSEICFEVGATLELAFCLPAERERNSCVLAPRTQ